MSAPLQERDPPRRHPLVDAFLLSGAVIVALGLARFSYALVLPSMRTDLGLSFAWSGGLGTANTLGYLSGVAALPVLLRLVKPRSAMVVGSYGVAVMLCATALLRDYPLLAFARFVTGVLGAPANVVGLALAAGLVSRHRASLVVFNAGTGIGIILAGIGLPVLLASHANRWPTAWLLLGAAGLLAATGAASARVMIVAARPGPATVPTAPTHAEPLHWLTMSYVGFGCGYIVYITFLVATLSERELTTTMVMLSFVLLGATCLVSPLMWSRLQRRWRPARLLCLSLAIQSLAGAILLLHHDGAVLVSASMFGLAFMASPTFTMATIRALRREPEWTTAMSRVTMPFAVAQAIAPWLSGAGIDRFGTAFAPWWTALCCAIGAVLAWQQSR